MTAASPTRPPALILGSGITALGVQRVLGQAGIPYLTAHRTDPLLTRSRWYRPLPGTGGPTDGDLEGWLRTSGLERAVVFPCSDRWVVAAAALDPGLADRFPASVPSLDSIETLVDKGRFLTLLRELDVPHPWSRTLEDPSELDQVPDHLFRDAFLKPRDSQRFMARFGVKAFRVQGREDARRRLEELGAGDSAGLLIQDYVPGPPSNHYFLDGFVDRGGTLRSLFARQRLRMYPPDFGNSSFMKSIPLDRVEPAARHLRRLLEAAGHRGIFSAEFKLDERDGVFRILEVNARAWWYVEFAARCGVDVCSQAYADALGEPVPTVTEYRAGRRGVHPYYDYWAIRNERLAGRFSVADWARAWTGAFQPVFRWSDPGPAVSDTAKLLMRMMRRRLKRGDR